MACPGTAACSGLDIPGSAAPTRAGPAASASSRRTTCNPRESPGGAFAFACAGAHGFSPLVFGVVRRSHSHRGYASDVSDGDDERLHSTATLQEQLNRALLPGRVDFVLLNSGYDLGRHARGVEHASPAMGHLQRYYGDLATLP